MIIETTSNESWNNYFIDPTIDHIYYSQIIENAPAGLKITKKLLKEISAELYKIEYKNLFKSIQIEQAEAMAKMYEQHYSISIP